MSFEEKGRFFSDFRWFRAYKKLNKVGGFQNKVAVRQKWIYFSAASIIYIYELDVIQRYYEKKTVLKYSSYLA